LAPDEPARVTLLTVLDRRHIEDDMPTIDRVRIAREVYGAYESGDRESTMSTTHTGAEVWATEH
jgi:hypothetical protein